MRGSSSGRIWRSCSPVARLVPPPATGVAVPAKRDSGALRRRIPAEGEGKIQVLGVTSRRPEKDLPLLGGPRMNRFWKSGRARFAAAGAVALAVAALASMGGVGYAARLVGVSHISPTAAQYPPSKVTICHHTHSRKNPFVTINVSERALPAHLGHGDTVGACPQQSLTSEQDEKPARQHGKAQHHSNGQLKGKKKGHAGGQEGSTQGSPLEGNAGQGHGHGQGQGQGQSKANGHSHGKGKGPGNDQGDGHRQPTRQGNQAHGHSNGQGQGESHGHGNPGGGNINAHGHRK